MFVRLFLLCCLLPFGAVAEPVQSLDAIRTEVKNYLQNQVGEVDSTQIQIRVGQFDPRLRLKACAKGKLETYLPQQHKTATTTSTVGVRCQGPSKWSLFVPVQVRMFSKVVVVKRPLGRGQRLLPQDLAWKSVDISRLQQGYFKDSKRLTGLILKQALRPGMVLAPKHVIVPNVINKGDAIVIKAYTDGISVSMKGLALSPGQMGQIIKVRSTATDKVIRAKVVDKKHVEVII